MKHILQITTEANNGLIPDFIFVIGDGASDERMFSSVLSFVSSQFQPPKPSKLFIEVAAAAWNETQAVAAELAGNEAIHSAAVAAAAASSSANNKSKVNNTILEVEDEDDENPLSLAAEKMLDEKPGQLSETTSKILSDAAKAAMSSGASSKGAASSASSSKAGNNNSSSSNSNGAYQAMFNRNKIARMESFMGGAEVDTTVFTCTVGKKASCAGTFMENVKDVEHLLKALSKVA
jgi:hypothetical protein